MPESRLTLAVAASFPKGKTGAHTAWALLLAAVVALLAGCEQKAVVAPAADVSGASTPAPTRIVSLAPSVTETLYALGAGARVVGVTRFCDYPPQAAEKPKVGGLTDVDIEVVLSLEPDLVVGVQTQTAESLQRALRAADINSLFLPVETLRDVEESFVALGDRLGASKRAAALVEALEAGHVAPGADPPRVLVLFGRDPWIGAGPGTFADEMVRATGGVNALATSEAPYPMLDAEQLGALKPDLVLDTTFGDAAAEVPGAGRTVRVDPSLIRPGPRLADAMKLFAGAIAEAPR